MVLPPTAERLLYDLLMTRFGSDRAAREELRAALRGWPGCTGLEAELVTSLHSPAHQVRELTDAIVRRGVLGIDLLNRWQQEMPGQREDLRRLADAWGLDLGLAAPSPPLRCLPPGTAYSAQHYVPWGKAEKRALSRLGYPGTPVVVCGPPRCGKTWFLQHLVEQVRARGARIYALDLDDATATDRRDYPSFLRWFTAALLTDRGPEQVEALWSNAKNLNRTLSEVLRTAVLGTDDALVVIAISRADRIRLEPYNDDLYGMLRARLREGQTPPWDRLRLLVELSGSPHEMSDDVNASVFAGLTQPEELLGFEEAQVLRLLEQYPLRAGTITPAELMRRVDRRPSKLRGELFERSLDGDGD